MAGGGAAASTDISANVKEPYGLILRGYTGTASSTGQAWSGDATDAVSYEYTLTGGYAANPSVLRYIKEKGITEAGGNPYEGVSAPSFDDMAEIVEDEISEIKAAVDEVDSLSTHVSNAVTSAGTVVEDINIGSVFNTVINDAIAQAASSIAVAVVDALSEANTIISNAESVGQVESGKVSSFEGDGLAIAGTELTDITTRAGTLGLETSSNYDAVTGIASILTKHSDVSNISSDLLTDSRTLESSISSGFDSATRVRVASLVGEVETGMLSMANNMFTQAFSNANSAVTGSSNQAIQTAKDLMTAAGISIQPDSQMYSAVNIAKMAAIECVGMAVSSATSAINESVITDMITSFRNEALKTHLKGAGRFAAGMSEINAVNSSAFIWGMAAMESDFENSVARFQAEVRYKLFSDAFLKFIDLLSVHMTSYMQVYTTQMSAFTQGYGQTGQVVSNVVGQFVSSYVQTFSEYLKSYANDKNLSAQVFTTASSLKKEMATTFAGIQAGLFERILQNKLASIQMVGQLEEGIISRVVESRTRLYMQGFEKQIEVALASAARRVGLTDSMFRSYFDGSVKEELEHRAQTVSFVLNNTEQGVKKEISDIELNRAVTTLLLEASRIKHVAAHEEFEANLEVDVNASHWDMELFAMAGNIIGSASGAVVHRPGKPSRTQSVLGGALAAASIAAAVPSGGTSLMLGSALAGGVAGAFM